MKKHEWTADQEKFGQQDWWATFEEIKVQIEAEGFKLRDDCDGAAVYERGKCREAGIATRYVLCLTDKNDWNSGHLVIEHEGWVLDSRFPHVESRDDLAALGYKFLLMSGFNPGDDWHLIEG